MDRLLRTLLKYLRECMVIPEEWLYEFTVATREMIQTMQVEQLPFEYSELERYVESYWRAKSFVSNQEEILYEMGRLLSLTSLLSLEKEEEKKRSSLNEYAEQYKDWYKVFAEIHENAGITHKQLARRAEKSESSLSQFMNKNQWKGIYIYRRFGREKSYYLTEYGEQLYEVMKNMQPRPRREKYARFLGTKTNINREMNMLLQDGSYKMSRSFDGKREIYRIYYRNSETTSGRPEQVAAFWMKSEISNNEEGDGYVQKAVFR